MKSRALFSPLFPLASPHSAVPAVPAPASASCKAARCLPGTVALRAARPVTRLAVRGGRQGAWDKSRRAATAPAACAGNRGVCG
eukprot:1154077-Pelagomonas_calceolata.AAC.2